MVAATPSSPVAMVFTTSPGANRAPSTTTSGPLSFVIWNSAPASVASPWGSDAARSESTLRTETPPRATGSDMAYPSPTTLPSSRTSTVVLHASLSW